MDGSNLNDTTAPTLITRAAVWVGPDTTVRDAAGLMQTEDIGALLVRGPHGTVGVLSERDVVAAVAEGAGVDATKVEEICTWEVVTVSPAMPLADVARTMLDAEIRHLPVELEGHATEMISERDVLQAYAAAR